MATLDQMIAAVEWAQRQAKGNARVYTGGPNGPGKPSWRTTATHLRNTIEYLRIGEKTSK